MKLSNLSALTILLIAPQTLAQETVPVASDAPPLAEVVADVDSESTTTSPEVEKLPAEAKAEQNVEKLPAEAKAEQNVEKLPAEAKAEQNVEKLPAEAKAEQNVEKLPAEAKAEQNVEKLSNEKQKQKPTLAAERQANQESSSHTNKDTASREPQDNFFYYLNHLDFQAGLKIQGYSNSSLNTWTQDKTWVGSDLRIGASSALGKRLSFSYNASYFFADKLGSLRGARNDLDNHNISLGLELGYLINSRIQAYARVAPGASLMKLRVGSESQLLRDNVWAFHSDQALGFKFWLLGSRDGAQRSPRFWFFAEAGYALGTSANIELAFDETELPNPASVDLGKLQLTGANGSFGFGLSY